jgi:hypothetical protein
LVCYVKIIVISIIQVLQICSRFENRCDKRTIVAVDSRIRQRNERIELSGRGRIAEV